MKLIIKKVSGVCLISFSLLLSSCSQSSSQQQNSKPLKNIIMPETFKSLQSELKNDSIKVVDTDYEFNGRKYLASFSYESSISGKRPGIIVIPEWWGLNDYVKTRAKMLAALGYGALAIDVFGNGDTANNPTEAMAFTKPYYGDPNLVKQIIGTALSKLKTFPQVDTSRVGIIGYCFGGYSAITAGVLGADVKAVVGFHPSLGGINPEKNIKAKVLVCAGGDDQFELSHFDPFKKRMKDADIELDFKIYPGAKHGFTNPLADDNGKKFGIPLAYNPSADSASWSDMKLFLKANLK